PVTVSVCVRPEKLTVKLLGVSRPSRCSRRGRKRLRRGLLSELLCSRVGGRSQAPIPLHGNAGRTFTALEQLFCPTPRRPLPPRRPRAEGSLVAPGGIKQASLSLNAHNRPVPAQGKCSFFAKTGRMAELKSAAFPAAYAPHQRTKWPADAS